jgi:hypothetical protein
MEDAVPLYIPGPSYYWKNQHTIDFMSDNLLIIILRAQRIISNKQKMRPSPATN